MNIDEFVEQADLIRELTARQIIINGQLIFAHNAPGFTHSHERCGGDQFDVFATRDVFFVEREVFLNNLTAQHDAIGKTLAAQGIQVENVPAIQVADVVTNL